MADELESELTALLLERRVERDLDVAFDCARDRASVPGRIHRIAEGLLVDARDPDDPACEVIDQLLEDGSVAMAVVPAADPAATAALLADRLGADGAFQLAAHPVHGAVLRPLGIVRSGDHAGAAVQAARR